MQVGMEVEAIVLQENLIRSFTCIIDGRDEGVIASMTVGDTVGASEGNLDGASDGSLDGASVGNLVTKVTSEELEKANVVGSGTKSFDVIVPVGIAARASVGVKVGASAGASVGA